MAEDDDPFDAAPPRDPRSGEDDEDALCISIDGFEGPLDLLLDLARRQKVDLRRISVLALAEQYLAFVERAQALRIDLAGDFLVMAAWLAYLKSRLLLPEPPADEGPSGEALAEALAHRLARLEAMRRAAGALQSRARLGQDRFARGAPESAERIVATRHNASLADLLKAYVRVRTREAYTPLSCDRRAAVLALEDARARLSRLVGREAARMTDWQTLDALLPEDWRAAPARRRSAIASSFAAALELAREGDVELRQEGPFEPLMVRPRREPGEG
ncbi:MAG: ScpA family protein [Pseudomonadota bacterium]